MNSILKILSVALTCSFAFKIGFPTAYIVMEHDFLNVLLVSCAGGVAGNVFFTFLSAGIIKAIHNFRLKRNMIHKKRIFTPFNKRVIKVKQKFGLAGIAFITPIFLSTPVGAFLAERFFKDKRKIILYLSLATFFWAFALYGLLTFFYDSFSRFFL
jgi:hypothetical protein